MVDRDSVLVKYLNIPDLPKSIVTMLTEEGMKVAEELRVNRGKNTRNIVNPIPGSAPSIPALDYGVIDPGSVGLRLLKQFLQKFIPYNVDAITVLVFRNINDEEFCECPPHTDNDREFSVNYVLRSGGKNVVTRFWRQYKDISQTSFYLYDDVGEPEDVAIKEKAWHVFNPFLPHSIHDIEDIRIVLIIMPKCSLEQMLELSNDL